MAGDQKKEYGGSHDDGGCGYHCKFADYFPFFHMEPPNKDSNVLPGT